MDEGTCHVMALKLALPDEIYSLSCSDRWMLLSAALRIAMREYAKTEEPTPELTARLISQLEMWLAEVLACRSNNNAMELRSSARRFMTIPSDFTSEGVSSNAYAYLVHSADRSTVALHSTGRLPSVGKVAAAPCPISIELISTLDRRLLNPSLLHSCPWLRPLYLSLIAKFGRNIRQNWANAVDNHVVDFLKSRCLQHLTKEEAASQPRLVNGAAIGSSGEKKVAGNPWDNVPAAVDCVSVLQSLGLSQSESTLSHLISCHIANYDLIPLAGHQILCQNLIENLPDASSADRLKRTAMQMDLSSTQKPVAQVTSEEESDGEHWSTSEEERVGDQVSIGKKAQRSAVSKSDEILANFFDGSNILDVLSKRTKEKCRLASLLVASEENARKRRKATTDFSKLREFTSKARRSRQTLPSRNLLRAYRGYAYKDFTRASDEVQESIAMCAVDPALPSYQLTDYIRLMASLKLQKAMLNSKDDQRPAYAHLANRLDESALTAVGVIFEELVRETIVSWKERCDQSKNASMAHSTSSREKIPGGGPLRFSEQSLATEISLQLGGADFSELSFEMVLNRLEALFGRKLDDEQTLSMYDHLKTQELCREVTQHCQKNANLQKINFPSGRRCREIPWGMKPFDALKMNKRRLVGLRDLQEYEDAPAYIRDVVEYVDEARKRKISSCGKEK